MVTLVLLASLALAGYALSYLALCYAKPFGRCRRCKGAGQRPGLIIRRLTRECRRCGATGKRVRVGRRLIEHVRTEYRAGQQ
ncbi:hypothetical protein [Micromonospora mirobrigensis]|uniref:Uncharacterized protein n=1 Tax=Micromonospora mirobrigensis TaxID=262898 RepID=A0A1C4ZM21_9ACTN|nr:hypothetical protein [Micromonospora mirobrigensis]SCF33978.1 hypothetical protein GA0070564_10647 [Micromonospora mirobrigensis]